MTVPTAEAFDEWYSAITVSPGWDDFVRRALDLPAEVESSSYLTGPGLLEVQERLALRPGETLVELGCGRAGYGLACIAASGAQLVGVDVSAVALDAAGRTAERRRVADRTTFLVADLADTGLPADSADAILAVDAFHFATSVPAAAAEVARVLKPGGRVVMTMWEARDDAAALRLPERIARMDIERDLRAAGLTDVDVEERPEWSRTETALWTAASQLVASNDVALGELRAEALEFLPLADALRRVLVTARRVPEPPVR